MLQFAKAKTRLFRDGRFVGTRSSEAIERLYAKGLVTLEHNNRGFVVAGHEHSTECPNTLTNNLRAGVSYSYDDPWRSDCRWDLKRLTGKRDGLNYAPVELRSLFLEVVTECLAS